MAITNCKECNNDVSSKAQTCPSCGVQLKPPPEDLIKGIALVSVIALVVIGSMMGDDETDKAPSDQQAQSENVSQPPAEWIALDKSEEMQAKRLKLIEDLKAQGVILKVETPTDYPRIYVGPAWNSITVDDKRTFANAVLTYYYAQDPEATLAVIRDGYTGKDIGSFSYRYGLQLD
jgi:hypothetical protein